MPQLANKKNLYWQLIHEPENALDYLNLIYVGEEALTITRTRTKNGFVYRNSKKLLKRKPDIERIKALVLPPAWEQVKIASNANAHLQATGFDEKSRKQYRYHSKWSEIRNQTKFYKMYAFGTALPKIRAHVEKDLKQKKFTRTKVLALIIKLLEETHIRIGNQQYATRNKTFGLSTLRSRHVDIYGNEMKFEFVGKRGKVHKITVRNKKLIKLVNQCEEIPGWKLFKFYDEHGEKKTIDSAMVNEYLQGISHDYFTAKDFRTWSGSLICFNTLKEIGLATDEKVINKNILQAIDAASIALGNTRATSRKYYVHPHILSSYSNGSIEKAFSYSSSKRGRSKKYFSKDEEALLSLIEEFNIQF